MVKTYTASRRDLQREAGLEWYRSSGLTGMMMYINNFAGEDKRTRA